ncbi:hypothetical protein, partial [Neisseria meningitidis]
MPTGLDSRLRGNDEISKLWRYRKNKKSKPENLSQTTGFQKTRCPAGMTVWKLPETPKTETRQTGFPPKPAFSD